MHESSTRVYIYIHICICIHIHIETTFALLASQAQGQSLGNVRLRAIRVIRELRMMVFSIISSFAALFWCLCHQRSRAPRNVTKSFWEKKALVYFSFKATGNAQNEISRQSGMQRQSSSQGKSSTSATTIIVIALTLVAGNCCLVSSCY